MVIDWKEINKQTLCNSHPYGSGSGIREGLREDPVALCRCKVYSKADGDWSLERSQERGMGRLRVAIVR